MPARLVSVQVVNLHDVANAYTMSVYLTIAGTMSGHVINALTMSVHGANAFTVAV